MDIEAKERAKCSIANYMCTNKTKGKVEETDQNQNTYILYTLYYWAVHGPKPCAATVHILCIALQNYFPSRALF